MKEHKDQLKKLNQSLQQATKFDEVLEVSLKIFFTKIELNPDLLRDREFLEVTGVILETLKEHLWSTKSIDGHKKLFQTILKLSLLSCRNCTVEFTQRYAHEYCDIGANAICAYAWLVNHQFSPQIEFCYGKSMFSEDFVSCSLKYSNYSIYFPLVIDNYIQAYDVKLVDKNDEWPVTVICTNLEDNHQGVGKLLLELFQKMLLAASENDRDLIDIPLNQLSWHNRNKYYLLTKIIATRPDLLTSHKDFNVQKVIDGLRIGLSQHHLFPCSLMLAKTIYNKDLFRTNMLKLSTDILVAGSEDEVTNFFNLWYTAFDDPFRNEIFSNLTKNYDFTKVSSSTSDFYRALIIRNGFKRELSPQLESSMINYFTAISDVDMKIEIFEILLHEASIMSEKVIEKILRLLRLLKFLHFNICAEDSNFRDIIIRKMPNFINFLATTRFRKVEIAREIFGIVRADIYQHGMDFSSYESTVFSLNFLSVILKQFCGCAKGQRLSKKTDAKTNQEFRQFLKRNGIWDITSKETFEHLVRLAANTENKDICTLANNLLVEYFIKNLTVDEYGEDFLVWIDGKVTKSFNLNDVEVYHENICYCIMKFEYLLAKKSPKFLEDLLLVIGSLKNRYQGLKISNDPVTAMKDGQNLFILMDCINYAISKMDKNLAREKVVPVVRVLTNLISQLFLGFINDGKSAPSFDKLDEYLIGFVEKSEVYGNEDLKHALLLSIFFTLRSCSELSVTISRVVNASTNASLEEFFTQISTCIEINIQIMTRSSHKGIIEAAAFALGKITKMISHEFSQQCNRKSSASKNLQKLLIKLKNEISCNRMQSSKTGEIRGTRGLMIMAHHIIRNHPPFVKFLMERLLVLVEIKSFHDTLEIKFAGDVLPIHLHLLAVVVKDAELVGEMRKYYDFILLATFRKYKETTDFIMQNALLQIIGCLTPKISNQKRHAIDESELPDYEHKSISAFEFYVKITYAFRVAVYDFERNMSNLSQTYIIILLQIFSNFEYRRPFESYSEVDRFGEACEKLLSHNCEKIRLLAAKCYAQWQLPERIPKIVTETLRNMFNGNQNLAHASIIASRLLIQRYEASIKFVGAFEKENFLKDIRKNINKFSKEKFSSFPNNFYLRCFFIDFLMFIGFTLKDDIVQRTINESTIRSKVGYNLWMEKIKIINQKFP